MAMKNDSLFMIYNSLERTSGCLWQYLSDLPIDIGLTLGNALNGGEYIPDLTSSDESIKFLPDRYVPSARVLLSSMYQQGYLRKNDRCLVLNDPFVMDVFSRANLGLVKSNGRLM
jgi:hypothetical protein